MHFPSSLVGFASLSLLSTILPSCNALPKVDEAEADAPIAGIAKRSVVYHSSTYPANAPSMTAIVTPTLVSSTLLGPASSSPASSYFALANAALPTLPASEQYMAVDAALTEDYAIWNGTGTNVQNAYALSKEKPLSTVPHYSRDMGKGGVIDGNYIFMFCDTNSYTNTSGYTGAASNSVSLDVGMAPASGSPPVCEDPVGTMYGKNGAPRGFIPLTIGEAAYNSLHNGVSRYAIWPEGGLINLNPSTALVYAPIVFSNISNGALTLSSEGMTLAEVTYPSVSGPVATRVVNRLFPIGSVEWGGVGGTRSYSSNGINGGTVYLFAKVSSGLLLAKVPATEIQDLASYQYYYPGVGWNSTMMKSALARTSCFYNGSFSTVDIFYSPRHLTYIMVYMNNYVDNTLYWRYLKATEPILPVYAGGNQTDIASYLTKYSWSGQGILLKLPVPPTSFSYGGGAQLGYFGNDDITRGGTKMLMTWTEPNGYAASSHNTSYWLNSAVATFS